MKQLFLLPFLAVTTCLLFANTPLQIHRSEQKEKLTDSLRGNGMGFTPNKGQIVNIEGKLCPEVMYKGGGGSADIYLRKTGISYVFSDVGKVMHEIDETINKV